MTMDTVWLKVDGGRVEPALREALAKLDAAGGEVILDFSSVHRIDSGGLRALEEYAAAHDDCGRIVLRGVAVDVYKAIQLVKLAPRYSFQA
jgi:anti-anti-sigma regulatory factor